MSAVIYDLMAGNGLLTAVWFDVFSSASECVYLIYSVSKFLESAENAFILFARMLPIRILKSWMYASSI